MKLSMATVLCGVLMVGACQREPVGEDAAPVPKTAKVAPAITVQEIQIGSNASEAKPQTTKEPIHIAVAITVPDGKTGQLKAKLFNLRNGQVVGEETKQIGAGTPAKIEFDFQSAKGWEPGRHLLELTLDGKLLKHQELDIFEPEGAPVAASN